MNKSLDSIIQECLSGIDAGLTPEECLSAWPGRREELEPLLRQALLLRLAYASTPGEEFRARARDKLMFVAGREARQVLAVDPDPHFVRTTRQRFMNAAGASAQEALRAVPPPRLAFWVNARRRLLEASAAGTVATHRAFAPTLRMSFSAAAVLVIAVAVAGLAYFSSQSARPTIGQELAAIEQQLQEIEEQNQAGNPAPTALLLDVSRKLPEVVDKLNTEQPQEATKAAELIDRTKAVAAAAPTVRDQVEQQLAPADQKVERIFAARVDTPIVQPTGAPSSLSPSTPASSAGSSTLVAPPAAPSPLPPTSTPAPLAPNQARLQIVADDTTAGISWSLLSTQKFSILVPTSWKIVGPTFAANGLATIETPRIILYGPDDFVMNIQLDTGKIGAIFGGVDLSLRGQDGSRMTVAQLLAFGDLAPVINHMLESVEVPPPPTPTPTGTATPAPAPTQTR